jgi:hydroxylaminobenzene mutase
MDLKKIEHQLIKNGVILFLIGLITGLSIQVLNNPRMGLAAHIEAIMNGFLLIIMGGIVWKRLSFGPKAEKVARYFMIYSAYANWVFIMLAAIFGTSRMTPLAGMGYTGAEWQEAIVSVGLATVSVTILVSAVIILIALKKRD